MNTFDPLDAAFDTATMRGRTVRGAGATAVAQALKFLLQFGTQIVLARMLDPASFGLVAMVAPVLGIVLTINDFGLSQAVVQRADINHRQVSALFWLNTAIGLALTLLAMALAPVLALIYGEPRVAAITVASAGLIFLTSLTSIPQALLNRQMRFVAASGIELVAMVAGLASGLLAAWLGAGYWSLVIMQGVNSVCSVGLAWWFCRWRPSRPAREPGVGSLLRFGAHVMSSNLATYLSMSVDNMIVGLVNGKVALGLYDRSYNLVVKPLMQLMAPAGRVAVPLLSRLQETPERYSRAYLMMLQLSTAASVPGLIATLIVAGPLIFLLLGPKWMAMVPIFRWICFGGLFSALSASCYWLLTTQNRTAEQMRFSTLLALIGIVSFLIGSKWGATGVACVSALSFMFVQTPLLIWVSTRRGPVTFAMVRNGLAPMLVAAAAAALVTRLALPLFAASALGSVLFAFGCTYLVFALTLGAQPAGRRVLSGARAMVALRRAAV